MRMRASARASRKMRNWTDRVLSTEELCNGHLLLMKAARMKMRTHSLGEYELTFVAASH